MDWPVPSSAGKNHRTPGSEELATDSLFKIAAAAAAEGREAGKPAAEQKAAATPSWQIQIGAFPTKDGAMRMIDDGALEGVDHVIALHMASGTEAGKIEIRSGYAMANADMFQATIYATGGHGASPHRGTDPVFMFAQLLNAIYGITARRINPVQPAVISIGAIRALPTAVHYATSKAAMIGFTKCLSREAAAFGIKVNAIAAGIFDTDLAQALPERWLQMHEFWVGRLGKPHELAEFAVFMCSDRNSYMNGEVVIVDGGAVT